MSDELPYTVGSKPHTVRIYKRSGRTNIYIRVWDSEAGNWQKRSLGHDDVDKAKQQAADLHAKLVKGERALEDGSVPLGRLFTFYRKHQTPQKSEREQKADARRIELFTCVLGAEKDPHKISRAEWRNFIEKRSAGAIDARGRPVPETTSCPACNCEDDGDGEAECAQCEGTGEVEPRKPVGPRTVERDLRFLLAVLNWATDWHTGEGYLLRENVARGYPVPQEKNPSRPVATDERVQKIREVAAEVQMEVTWGEKREAVPSHLPAIFDLAVETGRRLSAILNLRYSDLLPEKGPHGSIRWRAESDKEGRESVVPISARARQALDRHTARMRELGLRGIGDAPLFPAAEDASKPVGRHAASRFLRRAEKKAGVNPHDGSLWHAYRRRWATVRKKLPATDVAEAGGWSGPDTLQSVYQQADPKTMYEVISGGGELREASDG